MKTELKVFGYILTEDNRRTGERTLLIRRFLAEDMERWVITGPAPGGFFLCREGLFILGPGGDPSKKELKGFIKDACWNTPEEAHEFFKGWMKGYTYVSEAQRAHYLRVQEEDKKRQR